MIKCAHGDSISSEGRAVSGSFRRCSSSGSEVPARGEKGGFSQGSILGGGGSVGVRGSVDPRVGVRGGSTFAGSGAIGGPGGGVLQY